MKNKKIDEEIAAKVALKIDELKRLSPRELTALPAYTGIEFETDGKPQELGVYRETTKNGETLIIVQCKNTYFLGVGNMCVDGFLVGRSGQVSTVPDALIWEYT